MQGRWWWESRRNDENDHLWLAFGCEGGGGGGSRVETTKMTTSGSYLDAREVVVVGDGLKERKKNHLWLAFGCEGGGGGGRRVEMLKKTTSGSRLNAREVVVVRECHGFMNPCGLGICNPSPTCTHDTGSRVLPVSVIESHAVVYNHIKRENNDGTCGIDTTRAGIHGAPAKFSFRFVY